MTVTSINTNTFLSDFIIFLRDDLRDNITDPIVSFRPSNERFVLTAYPQRAVTYPIITVKDVNSEGLSRLGMQSELHSMRLSLEIRIWARNIKEKDELTQQVINRLRSTQFSGAAPKSTANIHDFNVLSAVNIDEPGDGGVKSKVIEVEYFYILGA
jgi:hypothetical protein